MNRPPAPHVQAALGAAQAKLPTAPALPGSARPPAAHVQAALGPAPPARQDPAARRGASPAPVQAQKIRPSPGSAPLRAPAPGPPPTFLQGYFLTRPGGAAAGAVQLKRIGPATQIPAVADLRPAGPGERLPTAVQCRFEALFGADFSGVRVHVGPQAAAIGALAFTQGSHLFFAPGQYQPATPQGQRLLAHELTHVVQQRAGRLANPFGSGLAVVQDPGLEAEAERMAILASRPAQSAPMRHGPQAPRGTVQRASRPKRKASDLELARRLQQQFDEDDVGEVLMDEGYSAGDLKEDDFVGKAESKDEDWDPASEAVDNLTYDDVNSSALRKGLSWTKEALGFLKIDSQVGGKYLCAVCTKALKKGQKIQRDHHPPWKRRLEAFLEAVAVDDIADLAADTARLKKLFNLRGSRLSHAGCNLGHAGEKAWTLPKTKAWLKATWSDLFD